MHPVSFCARRSRNCSNFPSTLSAAVWPQGALLSFLVLFASVETASLQAQSPDAFEDLDALRDRYDGERSIALSREERMVIERGPEGLTGRVESTERILHLRGPLGGMPTEEVPYSGLIALEEIEAWTEVPKGKGKYRRENVREFSHYDVLDEEIFHNDSRAVSFSYPEQVPGSITHLHTVHRYADARLMTRYLFSSYMPVLHTRLTVEYPEDVRVRLLPYGIDEADWQPVAGTGKKNTQTWTVEFHDLDALDFVEQAPGLLYHAPHVQLLVEDPSNPNDRGGDLDRMYRWYHGHIEAAKMAEVPALSALADSLCQGLEQPAQKAAALLQWVQQNIRYVAIEDGWNGLVPIQPDITYQVRYGDCKGMSAILQTMMRSQGLDARLAWVGTRRLPYRYDELANCSVDNHMIVAWKAEGPVPAAALPSDNGWLLIDPTHDQLAFGLPSPFIQGKQVLVSGPDAEDYDLALAPVVPADHNSISDSLEVELDGSALLGRGRMVFSGIPRNHLASILLHVPEKDWADMLTERHPKGNNRMRYSSVAVQGLEDPNQPLVLDYEMRIPEFIREIDGEAFVPAELAFPFAEYRYKEDRTLPVVFEYAREYRHVVAWTLPEELRVKHVPEASAFTGEGFSYRFEPRLGDAAKAESGLVTETVYRLETIELEPELVPSWNAMNAQRKRELNRSLVLQRP